MDNLIKKYKNVLLFIAAGAVCVFSLVKVYNFYEARLSSFKQQEEEFRKKLDLANKVISKESELNGLKNKFLPADSYSFTKLINNYLEESGLKVLSTRPAESSSEKEIVSSLRLSLSLKGRFENLINFLKKIEREKLLIAVSSLGLSGEEELDIKLEVIGLALKELDL